MDVASAALGRIAGSCAAARRTSGSSAAPGFQYSRAATAAARLAAPSSEILAGRSGRRPWADAFSVNHGSRAALPGHRVDLNTMAFRLPRDARLVRFPTADGLQLEGRLTAGSRDRGVVLCHPHPLYGGSMLTPVILTVEGAFHAAGFTTLAFNFRGVGGSEGTHGEGRAEVADVAGALAHLRAALDGQPSLIAVAGYSFGSHVGGQAAAADPGVGFYLGVAPVLARYDYGFLAGLRGRVALIGGTRDEFSDPARLQTFAASLPEPTWLRVLDADHFFGDALDSLAASCRDAIRWATGSGPRDAGPTRHVPPR